MTANYLSTLLNPLFNIFRDTINGLKISDTNESENKYISIYSLDDTYIIDIEEHYDNPIIYINNYPNKTTKTTTNKATTNKATTNKTTTTKTKINNKLKIMTFSSFDDFYNRCPV